MSSSFTTLGSKTDQLKNTVSIVYNGKRINALAQWDTGAQCTCISNRVVEQLSLISIGKADIQTPNSKDTRSVYIVDVVLPSNLTVTNVTVFDSEIGNQGIDILVGMNIIGLGDFAISNYRGMTSFSFRFPSEGLIDFSGQFTQFIKQQSLDPNATE